MNKIFFVILICLSFSAFPQNNLSALTSKAKTGDIEAQYQLGMRYLYDSHRGDDSKAVRQGVSWIEKSAKAGYPKAQFALAELIENIDVDDVKNALSKNYKASDALFFYKSSTNNGIKEGYSRIGIIFYREGNHKEAASWFSKGVDAGDLRSFHWLATMYGEGSYVKKDLKKAFEFNLYAAERGDKYAMQAVSEAYQSGSGVKKDRKKAEFWNTKQEQVDDDKTILE